LIRRHKEKENEVIAIGPPRYDIFKQIMLQRQEAYRQQAVAQQTMALRAQQSGKTSSFLSGLGGIFGGLK